MSNISVGGQAVIEGVMMQSKDKRAIAVRKSNGKIVLKKNNIKSWINETNINKIPFLRGSFIFHLNFLLKMEKKMLLTDL